MVDEKWFLKMQTLKRQIEFYLVDGNNGNYTRKLDFYFDKFTANHIGKQLKNEWGYQYEISDHEIFTVLVNYDDDTNHEEDDSDDSISE